ncbi:MAG: bifunctional 5,10-methylene-tetrahydrofolate dehydrogenase/5,10-methylene-tetrahydrofolate cyclohydrolase, partial [Clostridia bacterium]|nr:bifunctional 5,10-methylene-tetrahydrofolate dehydrogenase/5,10-methylene-tetrahydrofolate cyclohydrolase [Clostridia bacterium]
MKLIDGKIISEHIKQQVIKQVNEVKEKGIEPCLAVIIVGDDFASRTYVNNKKKT